MLCVSRMVVVEPEDPDSWAPFNKESKMVLDTRAAGPHGRPLERKKQGETHLRGREAVIWVQETKTQPPKGRSSLRKGRAPGALRKGYGQVLGLELT